MKIKNEKISAPADLARYIDGMWITICDGPTNEMSPLQCCLPNGAWELIFHLTPQRLEVVVDGYPVSMPEIAGFATKGQPVYWQVPGGASMFGIVLLPEVMELFVDRPSVLREKRYEDLRACGQPLFEMLLALAGTASTFQELTAVVFSALREFFQRADEEKVPSYFTEAMRLIRNNAETPTLDDLSEQVYVGKRQLQRIFQDKLGFGPKTYIRMLRFRDAIHYIQKYRDARMTDVAHDFGYSDQSHFIREFRDFTGQNPSAFFSAWEPVAVSSHHPV